jgi:ribosomal-protein-alanine N-acetyltransferase
MIRPATPADLPAVLALERATPTAPHWSDAEYHAILASAAASRRCLFVAEDERHTVAGFAVGAVLAGQGELESVAVVPGLRGRGIGRALCLAILSWCRAQRVAEVLLEVRAASAGPIHLYRSLGFVVVGRRPGYYADPVDDALVMLCRLA